MTTRGPNKFKEREVSRAMRAVRAGGLNVERVEFQKDGSFSVIGSKGTPDRNTIEPAIREAGDK